MRLSKTTLVYFAGQAVVSLSGFAATFAIATLEGSSVLGRYSTAVSVGGFLLLVPMQAISEAVNKRISEGRDRESFFSVGVLANAGLGVGIALGVVALGAWLRAIEAPEAVIVNVLSEHGAAVAALLLASAAFRTVRGALEGTKRVGHSGLLQAIDRVLRTGFQILVLLAGFGVAALIAGHALALFLVTIVGVALLGLRLSVPDRSQFRSVFAYAKYAWLGTLRTRVFGWFDTFVLSFFVSASLVGIYEAAWGIAALLGIVSLAIKRTLFPEISDLSADDDYGEIKSILRDALVFSGIFTIPGLLGAAVIGQRILRFYSPEFGRGAGVLLLLICSYAAEAYGSQFVSTINAINKPSLAYRVNLLFILASVTLTVSLTWAFSWYGAAVATASASALRTVLGYRVLSREIGGIPSPLADVGRQVFAAILMAAVVNVVAPAVPPGRPGTLFLVGLGAAVYLVTLLGISGTVRDKTRTLLPVSGS